VILTRGLKETIMHVVVSHGGFGVNVYGPFATDVLAMDWGVANLGHDNPFWSIEQVNLELVEDDSNAVIHTN